MRFPTLYKRNTDGSVQQWAIETDDEGYRTIHGKHGGKLVISAWTKVKGKNIGKKNETSVAQQTLSEVEAIIVLKKKKGYTEETGDIDTAKTFQVMLADDWKDCKDDAKFPLLIQPKLDGIRAYITKDGIFSRQNNRFTSCPHLEELLKPFFVEHPDLILDGELYNHELHDNFEEIVSLVKQSKITPEILARSKELVQFWCYDLIMTETPNATCEYRIYELLPEILDPYTKTKELVLVDTDWVNNQNEFDEVYERHRYENFEGSMARNPESIYQFKRTADLLKRKEFIDEEFEIVAVTEGIGNRAGTAGRIWFRLDSDPTQTFKANPKGAFAFIRRLWNEREDLIGKWGTVRYQNRTTVDNKPRFGRVIKIRDYE